ncbi:MAG TPA: NTP transferase domain-containing protein [Bacillota bacterium]
MAAGAGTRLRQPGQPPKPLHRLHGLPLLERAIRCAQQVGCAEILVVTGCEAERVEAWLKREHAPERTGGRVRWLRADDWPRGNGASLLAAARALRAEPFLLLMADHAMDVTPARTAVEAAAAHRDALAEGAALLVTDARLDRVYDPAEATKVRLDRGRVTAIGKDLDPFDAVDTGVFVGSPGLIAALRQLAEERKAAPSGGNEDLTLTAAAARLAAAGRLLACPLEDGWWVDVDDAAAWRHASALALQAATRSGGDGPVARYLNRPLSRRLTRLLARTPVTPNQITFIAFALAVAASTCFALGQPALGGLLCQLASVVDGCDGELARLRLEARPSGALLDTVLDRYADAAVITGLILGALGQATWPPALVWAAGLAALAGAPLSALIKDRLRLLSHDPAAAQRRYDPLRDDPPFLRLLPGNRDGRSLIVALAGLLGQPAVALAALALVTHLLAFGRLGHGLRSLEQRAATP